MHRIIVLLLIVLPFRLSAASIEIIADVNDESISSLDIEKRAEFITSLFGQKLEKSQILEQLIGEILITDAAQKLNITLSDDELRDSTNLFFINNFNLKKEEVDQYIANRNIDVTTLKRYVERQLLFHKMFALFNAVSDQEVHNFKQQEEKSHQLITIKEIVMPKEQFSEDLVAKLHNDNNFITEAQAKLRTTTLHFNKLRDKLKDITKKFEIGEISYFTDGTHTHIILVLNKTKLSYELLNSTLNLQQSTVQNSDLARFKTQKVDCTNFTKLAQVQELKVKMKDLNPELQVALSNININEIIEIQGSNDTTKLIMLCNIENNAPSINTIKQRIYLRKFNAHFNMFSDNMRKHAIINYHKKIDDH